MAGLDGAREMEESAFLAAIVGSSDDAIIGKKLDGTIVSWNPAAERLYGYNAAESLGQSIEMLMPPGREHEPDAILLRVRRGEHVPQFETVRRRKDGTELEVSVAISPIHDAGGRIVGASSITRKARTSEAIAALAAGVAHDFNNVLMVIRACAALLHKKITADDARRDLEQIDEAAQRGAELARHLLAFSKDVSAASADPLAAPRGDELDAA